MGGQKDRGSNSSSDEEGEWEERRADRRGGCEGWKLTSFICAMVSSIRVSVVEEKGAKDWTLSVDGTVVVVASMRDACIRCSTFSRRIARVEHFNKRTKAVL